MKNRNDLLQEINHIKQIFGLEKAYSQDSSEIDNSQQFLRYGSSILKLKEKVQPLTSRTRNDVVPISTNDYKT